MKILVPTILPGPCELARLLRGRGAQVTEIPVGRIVNLAPDLSSDFAWATHVVVTSRHALAALPPKISGDSPREFEGDRPCENGDSPCKNGDRPREIEGDRPRKNGDSPLKIAGDCPRLLRIGKRTSAEFLEWLLRKLPENARILRLKAKGVPDTLASLAERFEYRTVDAYANEPVAVTERIDFSAFDAAAFTCASSVRRIFAAWGQAPGKCGVRSAECRVLSAECAVRKDFIPTGFKTFAIGATTAAELERFGFVPRVAARPSVAELVNEILKKHDL